MRSVNYHPIRFYITVYAVTWTFWILASHIQDPSLSITLMLLGLITPAVTAVVTVMFSGSQPLKADLKRKLTSFADLHPLRVQRVVLFFGLLAGLSILVSILFFGQPWSQFSFTEGFSFSIQGSSALLTILMASVIEEVGWRGYGEDSIAQSCSWFWESIWFGVIWSLWHLPLFFIPGTYQARTDAAWPGLCSELSGQCHSAGLYHNAGLCGKQSKYAGVHSIPSVCQLLSGKDCDDARNQMY